MYIIREMSKLSRGNKNFFSFVLRHLRKAALACRAVDKTVKTYKNSKNRFDFTSNRFFVILFLFGDIFSAHADAVVNCVVIQTVILRISVCVHERDSSARVNVGEHHFRNEGHFGCEFIESIKNFFYLKTAVVRPGIGGNNAEISEIGYLCVGSKRGKTVIGIGVVI